MGTLSFQFPTGDGAACQVAASMLAAGHLFPTQLSKHHGHPLTASTQELQSIKTKPKIEPVDKDDCRGCLLQNQGRGSHCHNSKTAGGKGASPRCRIY
jgi:hypothetical protein